MTRPFLILKSAVPLFTVHARSNRQARAIAARQIVGSFMVLAVKRDDADAREDAAREEAAFADYDAEMTALGM